MLCKGLKYREPASINFWNCKPDVKNILAKLSSDWCNKKGVPVKCFTQQISLVMENFNKRIKELQNKFKFSKVKQLLKDPKVISCLNILQEQCHTSY